MSYIHEFVDARGIRFHCLSWAGDEKRSFFILHANSHCAGVYESLGSRLAEDGSRVVAMDMRGHGRSDKPESGYDWESLRDDAVAVIEALDLSNVVLVGHSRGGAVSLMTAAALPNRVVGLVAHEPTVPALSPSGGYVGRSAEAIASTVEHAIGRQSQFASRAEALEYFRGEESRKTWQEQYRKAYVEHGTIELPGGGIELACPARVQQRLFEAQQSVKGWDAVHRSDIPVTVTFGELTGRGVSTEPAILAGMFEQLRTVILPGATHSGPQEYPERFEAEIKELASVVRAPASK